MRIVALLVARMGSTRLPGKSLMPIAGRPMLQLLFERARSASEPAAMILATSTDEKDNPIAGLGEKLGVEVFRGSENDVLERQLKAAEAARADAVIEMTGDNPFVDARLLDSAVRVFRKCGPECYIHTDYERKFPLGYVCQVYSVEAMKEAYLKSEPGSVYREHANLYIYRNPDKYPPKSIPVFDGAHRPELRLTIDYNEDYQLAKSVFEAQGIDPLSIGIDEVVRYIDAHPEIARLNAHCEQHKPSSDWLQL